MGLVEHLVHAWAFCVILLVPPNVLFHYIIHNAIMLHGWDPSSLQGKHDSDEVDTHLYSGVIILLNGILIF